MITDYFLPIFIPLVAAHLVADFLIQSDESIKNKNRFWGLAKHGLIVGVFSYLFLGILPAWDITLGIVLTHILLDYWKVTTKKGTNLRRFVIDQTCHVLILLFISLAAGMFKYSGYVNMWTVLLGSGYLNLLTLVGGGIMSIYAASFLVELALDSVHLKNGEDEDSDIREGGRIIGYLERSLIFLFILVDYPAGIGFLIAAKSIFRFGELTSPHRRGQAEYIIIGTLLSILFGTAGAYLTAEGLKLLLP